MRVAAALYSVPGFVATSKTCVQRTKPIEMCNQTPGWAVDLNATIVEVEKIFRSVVGDDARLRTRLDPALGLIRLDPRKIESVLVNLLMRARDVTPPGGDLTLATGNVDLDEAAAREMNISPGFYVFMELFVYGAVDVPANVRDTIRQAGGAISISPAEGRGTIVSIGLPAETRPAHWTY
jgi:hypothetical protein